MPKSLKHIFFELKSRLDGLYGGRLSRLVLFGSHARGDAEAESDIDVLVVLKGRVRAGMEVTRIAPVTAALSLTYDVVISCVFVSEERYLNEMSPLLINVRREGVSV